MTDPAVQRTGPGASAPDPAAVRAGPRVLVAMVVGLALRTWEAVESSLWLDELHTLSHASRETLGEVLDAVAGEFHTPLFFAAVHLAGDWEQGAWLRAIPVLSSLVIFLPLLWFARTAGSAGARRVCVLAAWLFACLPFHVHFAAMLRPYSWVGIFSALAMWIAFTERGTKLGRFLGFFACVLLGLWTHRIMAITVFSIGAARLVVRRPGMLPLGWLILAGTLAVAPTVPWLLGFAEYVTDKRFEHQEEVGGWTLRMVLVKEVISLPARLFVPYMGVLKDPWSSLARLGAAVFFLASAVAAVGWAGGLRRRAIPRPSPQIQAALVCCALEFFLISAFSIYSWDRVPLQYYTPITWALPLFVAWFAASWPAESSRRVLTGVLMGSALLLGIAQAGGRCTEDMRRGVETVREVGERLQSEEGAEPYYTALLSQPSVFDHLIPYHAYGRDLPAVDASTLPQPGDEGHGRPVVVLRRAMPLDFELWDPVKAGREIAERIPIDEYLTVYVFRPAAQ